MNLSETTSQFENFFFIKGQRYRVKTIISQHDDGKKMILSQEIEPIDVSTFDNNDGSKKRKRNHHLNDRNDDKLVKLYHEPNFVPMEQQLVGQKELIWEIIQFLEVPFVVLVMRSVCSTWNVWISNDFNLNWKNKFHELLFENTNLQDISSTLSKKFLIPLCIISNVKEKDKIFKKRELTSYETSGYKFSSNYHDKLRKRMSPFLFVTQCKKGSKDEVSVFKGTVFAANVKGDGSIFEFNLRSSRVAYIQDRLEIIVREVGACGMTQFTELCSSHCFLETRERECNIQLEKLKTILDRLGISETSMNSDNDEEKVNKTKTNNSIDWLFFLTMDQFVHRKSGLGAKNIKLGRFFFNSK
ncbi:hypothetical protein C9374_003951 [Naegleria lovaniensis]|uniref:F-box domain-containing protein n=1 Tax=Naegleria lovaniensis TaxID=51637 RepID=A0AA88H8W5_NAELO|nr:uncharacterized protein C9374_003951 [Naegleria lovaniensis]KAG2394187.1 hypothetical protein C9374_003951 [Naegleria lovaniensis]